MKLPSNLSGLLELRYKGDKPQIEDTIKLIDAINDMKKRPLPCCCISGHAFSLATKSR